MEILLKWNEMKWNGKIVAGLRTHINYKYRLLAVAKLRSYVLFLSKIRLWCERVPRRNVQRCDCLWGHATAACLLSKLGKVQEL